MTAKKKKVNRSPRFKPAKLLIARRNSGFYIVGTQRAKVEFYKGKFYQFTTGSLRSFCSRDFGKIFPHLKLKMGKGPFLIEVSAKLLKMPKKKAKK